MIRTDRSTFKYFLLTICTCGIYGFNFCCKMADDVNVICEGDGKETVSGAKLVLLTFCTCGIYGLIWNYSLANRLSENASRYGLTIKENGSSVIMWSTLGVLLCCSGPFVGFNIIIKNMNALASAYNKNTATN